MIAGSAELTDRAAHARHSNSRKRAVIGRLLEGMSVSDLVRNFIYVIINHRRIGMMS